MICRNALSVVNPRLLVLGATALIGAGWLCIKKEDPEPNRYSAETAGSPTARATSKSDGADQSQYTKTDQLLAEVREQLIQAQRAKEAAEVTLEQARKQLALEKVTTDTSLVVLPKKKPKRAESNRRHHSRR